jgi:DNA-binding transcriptional MocR family regulator
LHDLMFNALKVNLPRQTLNANSVKGGLYLWCRLNGGIKCKPLLELAARRDLLFASGSLFYPDEAGDGEMRLCFTSAPRAKIEVGIKRLAECIALMRA